MKFVVLEDLAQDAKTIETKSKILLEFQLYNYDKRNPAIDQIVAQLEQRISSFGASNGTEKDETGASFTMYRVTGKTFDSPDAVANFFKTEFKDFSQLMQKIWSDSDNFVRVVLTDTANPPNRIPGRTYTLIVPSDFQDMLMNLTY